MKARGFLKASILGLSLISLSGCENTQDRYFGPGHTFRIEPYIFDECPGLGDYASFAVDFTLVSISQIVTEETDLTYLLFDVAPDYQKLEENADFETKIDPYVVFRSDGLASITFSQEADLALERTDRFYFEIHFGVENKPSQITLTYENRSISKISFAVRYQAWFSSERYFQIYWMP